MGSLPITGLILTVEVHRVGSGGRNRKWPVVGGPCAAVHEIFSDSDATQVVGGLQGDGYRAVIYAAVEGAGQSRRGYRGGGVDIDTKQIDRAEIPRLVLCEVDAEVDTLLTEQKRASIGLAGAAECVVSGLDAGGVAATGIVRVEGDRYRLFRPAGAVRLRRQRKRNCRFHGVIAKRPVGGVAGAESLIVPAFDMDSVAALGEVGVAGTAIGYKSQASGGIVDELRATVEGVAGAAVRLAARIGRNRVPS